MGSKIVLAEKACGETGSSAIGGVLCPPVLGVLSLAEGLPA